MIASSNGSKPTPAVVAATSALVKQAGGDSVEGIVMQPQRASPQGLTVTVRNMVKHFNTPKGVFRAVDGVDVEVEPSSIVALLGPSGSGKTTLLRLIAGLETPTAGRIYFDDFDTTDLSVQERHIGFVFQSYALFNHKTVAQNIKFGLEVRGLKVDYDKRVADLLELVQLQGLGNRYPKQLSGGQRQRVALARALGSNPRLLLLDEPFGALDAVVRKQLRSGLKEIVRTVGITTIIVTHDQEEAFDLADKVVVFNRGVVEQQGPPTEIIKKPLTPFIMKFVGATNVVPATSLVVRRARFQARGKPHVMFRPSDMRVSAQYDTFLPEHAPTAVVVKERLDLGWVFKYTFVFDDDVEIYWEVSRDQEERDYNFSFGQRVYVHVPAYAMMAYEDDDVDSAPRIAMA